MAEHALINTLVAAIVLAFILGFAAQRFKLSPIVGYLMAGLAVGPHTPGFTANLDLALQLSEIGVILLMFGVGLKISIDDIWSVRWVAVPGALIHTLAAAALGAGLGLALGMSLVESLLMGSSISIASTIVLLRALEDRRLTKTEEGRICISWLLMEDLLIVLAIVILPALVIFLGDGGGQFSLGSLALAIGISFAKIGIFAALMLVVGARVFPWFIVRIAHTKSRELLSLGTLALALGVAYAAFQWFDASFALGAFLGGMALNGTKFSHRVAEDSLPLRDTFAVLFFVAVGMLFDPSVIMRQPIALAAIVAAIVVGKSLAAYGLMRLFGQNHGPSLLVALGLAQIGEFSFVLAGLGRTLGVLEAETYSLILAGALISIALNPFLLRLVPHTPIDEDAPSPKPAAS
jgi:CPA2 family monovalent cation:H+ antiporter-2